VGVALPVLRGKHDMQKNVRVSIRRAMKMSLLTELETFLGVFSTKMPRLRRWGDDATLAELVSGGGITRRSR